MPGLLSLLGLGNGLFSDRTRQGLLGFAGGMLSQGATPYPQGFGQAFGRGLLGAQQGLHDYSDEEAAAQLAKLREREMDMSGKRLGMEEQEFGLKEKDFAAHQAQIDMWNQMLGGDTLPGSASTYAPEPTSTIDSQYSPTGTMRTATPGGAPAAKVSQRTPRGLRNNNPGNIIRTDISWAGEVPGDDSAFETFGTPEAGLAAMAKNLRGYQTGHGDKTLRAIINRYSPPDAPGNTPEATENYISAVSQALGVGPDDPVNLTDPAIMQKLMPAMIGVENAGQQPFDNQQIAGAIGGQAAPDAGGSRSGLLSQVADTAQPQTGGGLLQRLTPEQRQMLRLLGPEAGMKLLGEQMFDQPAYHAPINMGGTLVNPDTGQPISGAYQEPQSPTTRTINRGSAEVTQQLNPTTGQWEDQASAPRWEPQQPAAPKWSVLVSPDGSQEKEVNELSPEYQDLAGQGWTERRPAPLIPAEETALSKGVGETEAKQIGDALSAADAAGSQLQALDQLQAAQQALQAAGSDTGALAGIKNRVAAVLQDMGISPDSLGLPPDAGPAQALQAATNKIALTFIGPGGLPANNFSEADRNFLVATVPNLSQTPTGLQMVSAAMKKTAERNIAIQNLWLDIHENEPDANKAYTAWKRAVTELKRQPLFSAQEKAAMQAAARAPAALSVAPSAAPSLYDKYGLTPPPQ